MMNNQENNKLELTKKDYEKINESLIRNNPGLARIDERIIYDKAFLLEVSVAGYNPLDREDVQNFLDKKPPKNLERNLTLCGADKYSSLGQSEFEEIDMNKLLQKHIGIKVIQKKPEDVYLTDIPINKVKDYLIEEKGAKNLEDMLKESKNTEYVEPQDKHKESEDEHRKNIAKALGVDDMFTRKEDYAISESKGLIKKDGNTEKMLELIKELRALGFSPEEIKKEIQRFH
jgi:hypothetical protein